MTVNIISILRRAIPLIVCATVAVSAQAAPADYNVTAAKAARFFDSREWASAQALYGLMLDERPDSASTYVHAIVASAMLGHDDAAARLLTGAMNAGVAFAPLMRGVREVSFGIGEAGIYEAFLLRSQRDCPWLERAIDGELLDYYRFRDDGPMTVRYARKMLAGLPGSTAFLSALAEGYVCEGDFGNAVAAWRRILDLDPSDLLAMLNLGNYYAITGNNPEAVRYLSMAQSLRPTPFVAARLRRLGYDVKKP